MPTLKVVLSEQQHELVDTLVRSGRYQNASEVLREGLRLVEQRERREAAKLKALQEASAVGWADIAAGRYTAVDHNELEAFIERLGQQAARRAGTPG